MNQENQPPFANGDASSPVENTPKYKLDKKTDEVLPHIPWAHFQSCNENLTSLLINVKYWNIGKGAAFWKNHEIHVDSSNRSSSLKFVFYCHPTTGNLAVRMKKQPTWIGMVGLVMAIVAAVTIAFSNHSAGGILALISIFIVGSALFDRLKRWLLPIRMRRLLTKPYLLTSNEHLDEQKMANVNSWFLKRLIERSNSWTFKEGDDFFN